MDIVERVHEEVGIDLCLEILQLARHPVLLKQHQLARRVLAPEVDLHPKVHAKHQHQHKQAPQVDPLHDARRRDAQLPHLDAPDGLALTVAHHHLVVRTLAGGRRVEGGKRNILQHAEQDDRQDGEEEVAALVATEEERREEAVVKQEEDEKRAQRQPNVVVCRKRLRVTAAARPQIHDQKGAEQHDAPAEGVDDQLAMALEKVDDAFF